MPRVFAIPSAFHPPAGRAPARFPLEPMLAGQAWWVIRRSGHGGGFTAMLPHPEASG